MTTKKKTVEIEESQTLAESGADFVRRLLAAQLGSNQELLQECLGYVEDFEVREKSISLKK